MIQEKIVPVAIVTEEEDIKCDNDPSFPGFGSAEEEEQRRKQIAALAMSASQKARSSDSWRRTVGKYEETSALNRILERGQAMREAERDNS